MKTLTTNRLLLRKLKFSDVNEIVDLDYSIEVYKYASINFGHHHFQSKSDLKKKTKSMVRETQPNELKYVIESKQDGKFIGIISIGDIPSVSPLCVSYKIKVNEWGKGITTEAVTRVLEYVFGEMKVSSVSAVVHIDNAPSHRVLEKTGFQKTGFLYGGINPSNVDMTKINQNNLSIRKFTDHRETGTATYLIYKSFYPGLG